MKKSFLALTSVGIAAMLAPAAQGAGSPFVSSGPVSTSGDKSVQVAVSDSQGGPGVNGGWCNNGKPSSAIAVRNTGKARTLYVTVTTDSGATEKLYTLKNVDSHGAFVLPLPAGPSMDTTFEVGTSLDPDGMPNDDGLTWAYGTAIAPMSCAGLPTQLPNLPSGWGSSTPTPVKTTTTPAPVKTTSAPTKSSNPVVTPTKPAPSTSKASATVTVKVTTPGGTKTTSTSGVVPVTKPIPAGGVTASATVKIPSKGVTATATETVKPITSSSSAVGPKVQTDGSTSNNTAALELMGATALVALGGGLTVAARRR